MNKPSKNAANNPALEDAIKAAGGLTDMAFKLSMHTGRLVQKQNIDAWRKQGLPPAHCPSIEAVSGVKCEKLRPDIKFVRKNKKAVAYIVEI